MSKSIPKLQPHKVKKMGISQADSKPEGRIPTLIGIIKRLVFEDPIIGLLCLIILFPVGYAITSNAITGEIENLPILLGVEAATVALCIPLIITKTWKNNQREIAEQKAIAIAGEVKRRVIREEHKQARFDDVMDAKIRNLEAQTTYILDRSASHEKQLLVASIQEVKELFQKNEELGKVQVEYDGVLESLERIEGQLTTRAKPPAEIAVADSIEVDETDYKILFEQKRAELANMRERNEELSDEIIGQKDNLADVKAEGERLQIKVTELATKNHNLEQRLKAREPKDSHSSVNLKELIIQSEKLASKVSDVQPAEPTSEDLQKALEAVDGLSDESPEVGPQVDPEDDIPPNCWKCRKVGCGRFNNLKQNRCPKCGSSKPIMKTNA